MKTAVTLVALLPGIALQGQKIEPTKAFVSPAVEIARLPPRLKLALLRVGDRLTRPGKEQATATGTIKRGSGTLVPIVVIEEPRGKIRITVGQTMIGADGANTWSGNGVPDESDADLLETLLNDSFDNLVSAQSAGAIRYMGARFRTDNGRTQNYKGPYYDIYEFADSVLLDQQAIPRQKTFLLNSDTGFLEKVIYSAPRGKTAVSVQTSIAGWKTVDGQSYPTSITRFEDGVPVLSIEYSTVNFGGASVTDIFRSAVQ